MPAATHTLRSSNCVLCYGSDSGSDDEVEWDDAQTELYSGESSPSHSLDGSYLEHGGYGSDDTTYGVDQPKIEANEADVHLSNAFTQYDSDDSAATNVSMIQYLD